MLREDGAAVAAFHKLIDRLLAMPASRREASNRRLQRVLDQALIGLHVHHVMLGQYDEALAIVPQAIQQASEEEGRALWQQRAAKILILKGDIETGSAELLAQATTMSQTLQAWADTAIAYVDAGRPNDALAAVEAMAQVVAEATDEGRSEEADRADRAFVTWIRMFVELGLGNAEQAVICADEAMALSDGYQQRRHTLYSRLVRQEQDELALRTIQRDQANPIGAGFWRGLALRHQGRTREAEQAWRSIAEIDLETFKGPTSMEYFLSHYALGDPNRHALSLMTNSLSRRESLSWIAVFLAALGWAVQGEVETARSQMKLARAELRAQLIGHQLPDILWYICGELLDPARLEPLAEYFSVKPAAAPTLETQPDPAVA